MIQLDALEDRLEELVVELEILFILVVVVVLVLGHAHLPNVNLAAGVKPLVLRFEHWVGDTGNEAVAIIQKSQVVQGCIGVDLQVCAWQGRDKLHHREHIGSNLLS
jgi:hypothetical protein